MENWKLPRILVIDVNAWRNDAGSNTLREIFSCWDPERLAVVYTSSQLPDSEKQYDRDMAMQTIKLMRKLGYDLVSRNARARLSHCAHCGATLSDEHRFCHRCGESVE